MVRWLFVLWDSFWIRFCSFYVCQEPIQPFDRIRPRQRWKPECNWLEWKNITRNPLHTCNLDTIHSCNRNKRDTKLIFSYIFHPINDSNKWSFQVDCLVLDYILEKLRQRIRIWYGNFAHTCSSRSKISKTNMCRQITQFTQLKSNLHPNQINN